MGRVVMFFFLWYWGLAKEGRMNPYDHGREWAGEHILLGPICTFSVDEYTGMPPGWMSDS